MGAESLAAGRRQSGESVSPPSCSFLACDLGRSEDLPLLRVRGWGGGGTLRMGDSGLPAFGLRGVSCPTALRVG